MASHDITDTCHVQEDRDHPKNGNLPPGLSPEDKAAVLLLFQTCPKLWQDFKNIIDICDLIDEDITNYGELIGKLLRCLELKKKEDYVNVCRLAIAVGFAEQVVKLYRHIMAEIGTVCLYEIFPAIPDSKMLCLATLWSLFQNFTHFENNFRLRLGKTGFLKDLTEGLKNISHIDPDALERGRVCKNSLGTLHNCCKNPEVVTIVKQMDIAQLVAPFLLNRRMDRYIRLYALMTLAFIVDDNELGLLELDHDLLNNCLHLTLLALQRSNKTVWEIEETLVGLSLAARLGFNRRLIVARDGSVQLLNNVLKTGTDVEKEAASAFLAELAKDPENVKLFQRDKSLVESLSALRQSENRNVCGSVDSVLFKIQQTEPEDFGENPVVEEVLADQQNLLPILGMGRVEFVLDQLTDCTARGSSSHDDVMLPVKVLRALTEIAGKDDSCKREILARGGLGFLQRVLEGGEEKEKLQAANLVIELTSCKEYCILAQAHTVLMEIVTALKQKGMENLPRRSSTPLPTTPLESVSHFTVFIAAL